MCQKWEQAGCPKPKLKVTPGSVRLVTHDTDRYGRTEGVVFDRERV